MKHIRVATEAEIESIKDQSDLSRPYTVFAHENSTGSVDLAVVRPIIQLDPVHFAKGTNDVQKAKFIYSLEERMIGAGIGEYYFAVAADDARWSKVVESWGAERVSKEPQFRYKKAL